MVLLQQYNCASIFHMLTYMKIHISAYVTDGIILTIHNTWTIQRLEFKTDFWLWWCSLVRLHRS